jgi:hypothetical protein
VAWGGFKSAMHESERLSTLIGTIYDTALDPRLWVAALDGAKDFVSGRGSPGRTPLPVAVNVDREPA